MPKHILTVEPGGAVKVETVVTVAKDRAKTIPSWATWDEDQAQSWIDTNVTDLASARTALKAMARLLVALRDAQWPDLTD